MRKICLELHKQTKGKRPVYVKASLPFVKPRSGKWIHRVRSATYHSWYNPFSSEWEVWISVICWCGNSFNLSSRKGGRFLDGSTGFAVCPKCEANALKHQDRRRHCQ